MPPRKSLDTDAEVAKLLAKIDKLKTDEKLTLGELVIETGIHKLLDADQLRDALLRLRDQVRAHPAAQGGRHDDAGIFPAQPETPRHNGHGHAAPEPARHRPPDLLAGAAPGRASSRPATEDTGLDRAS